MVAVTSMLSVVKKASRALLVSACLVASVVRADVGAAAGPPPGGVLVAQIQLLGDRVHVGDRVRLSAAGVQLLKELHVAWDFERLPPASHAKFTKRSAAETSFDADVPGIFVVRLTVRLGAAARTATLSLAVTEPGPLVPVNTLDVDGQGNPGMRVGSQFYPDPGKGAGFHVLVLDRNTLELFYLDGNPGNFSVPVTASAISTGLNFAGLPDSTMVLVTLPSTAPAVAPSDVAALNTALATIGAVVPSRWLLSQQMSFCWSSNLPYCYSGGWSRGNPPPQGSFSVIGIPGMAPGSGWYDDAAQRGTPNGPLVGYLTPGTEVGGGHNANAYTFVFGADQYVLVDTCVSGGPSACVIRVGSQIFAPQVGVNGFHVVVLDRVTLKPLADQTVTSTQGLYDALTRAGGAVGHFVAPVDYGLPNGVLSDRVVAVIQSVGTGALDYDDANPLLQAIDWLGGTPETIGAAITGRVPYALIGTMSDLPWHGTGIESSPIISAQQPGRSRGVLARDRRARYTPSTNDPVGFANLDLFPIVYQNPTPWPYAGSCTIQYIANGIGVGVAYPDIRSGYSNENIIWTNLDPTTVPYPLSPPDYCSPFPSRSNYQAIQAQLKSEFAWVMEVRLFIQNLKSPFVETQGSTSVIVTDIADQIYNTVKPPSNAPTTAKWLTIFNEVAPVVAAVGGGVLPAAAPVLGAIAASGKIAAATIFSPATSPFGSGAAADQVIANAIDLGTQLNDQLLAHLASLGRLEAILVGDAGKLQAVGTNLIDNADWQWSPNSTSDAVNALNATTRQAVYSALLPPTWPLYSLKPDMLTQFSSADVTTFGCGWANEEDVGGFTHTFAKAVADNQFHSLVHLVPTNEPTTEVWTFGTLDPYFNWEGVTATVPSTALTDSLFSTGADGAAAYAPAWYRATYNPPSHVTCGTNHSNSASTQKPPAVIPPPEAAVDGG